jgi:molecular chaperone DnaK
VSFDIDANGILHVGAKDKASGKENKITIKANSGLSEAEIQKMVQDAAAHAEEDKRVKEVTESRNAADALIHSTRKTLGEYGDKLDSAGKERIEAAIKSLESVLNGNDKAEIDSRIAALSSAAQKLGEKMYADAQQAGGATADAGETTADRPKAENDDVVDADFKEVKK